MLAYLCLCIYQSVSASWRKSLDVCFLVRLYMYIVLASSACVAWRITIRDFGVKSTGLAGFIQWIIFFDLINSHCK